MSTLHRKPVPRRPIAIASPQANPRSLANQRAASQANACPCAQMTSQMWSRPQMQERRAGTRCLKDGVTWSFWSSVDENILDVEFVMRFIKICSGWVAINSVNAYIYLYIYVLLDDIWVVMFDTSKCSLYLFVCTSEAALYVYRTHEFSVWKQANTLK